MRKDAPQVTNVLKNQLEQLDEKIKQNDLDIFYHFNLLERESGKSGKLRKLYREFFDFDRESDLKIAFYSELLNDYSFVNEETPFDTIKSNFNKLKPKEEKLRSELKEMLDTQETLAELSEETIGNLEKFTAESHVYFNKESYNDENLSLLFTAIDSYGFLISRKFFRMKKEILDYQYELYKEAKVLG